MGPCSAIEGAMKTYLDCNPLLFPAGPRGGPDCGGSGAVRTGRHGDQQGTGEFRGPLPGEESHLLSVHGKVPGCGQGAALRPEGCHSPP